MEVIKVNMLLLYIVVTFEYNYGKYNNSQLLPSDVKTPFSNIHTE